MKRNSLVSLFLVVFMISLLLAATNCQVSSVIPKVEAPKVLPTLAWTDVAWTEHLIKEIDSKVWSPEIKNHCKVVDLKTCIAQTLSIMAKYESGYNPKATYRECKKDKCVYSKCEHFPEYGYCMVSAPGKMVTSRGLFQLSIGSVNGTYKCGIKTDAELDDPLKNISCMVNIANYWLNKDLVFYGVDKNHKGFGRYHSVLRAGSKSYPKVIKYLEVF